jgi:predicted deacetylase
MRFLLSIHDVWPGNLQVVETHWQRLRSLGAGPAALLVVPAYHGRRPIEEEPEFLAWLREKAAAGSEILLHGFRHLAQERLPETGGEVRRTAWGRWVNRSLVGWEAELCGLPDGAKRELVRRGGGSFRRAGLPLLGFVAPTWHGTPSRVILRDEGFRIRETRLAVQDLASGRSRFAPPLAWMARPDGQGVRLPGGRAALAAMIELPLIKVAVHPGDLDDAGAVRALERVAASGSPVSYAGLFSGPPPGSIR